MPPKDENNGSEKKVAIKIEELFSSAVERHGLDSLPKNKLRIKVGFDPTAPDLHLGHSVVLTAMRKLQDYGHTVVFVVGDFTALIGDPTGRDTTRPPLTETQIISNAKTYIEQASKVLDTAPDKLQIRYNSEWLGKLSSADWVRLASSVSVAQMLAREDFNKRYKTGISISLHEFLYPLAQAMDSVVLGQESAGCHIEMGGTDQLFNLLLGRELMRQRKLKPQAIVTWPLLEGLDGERKMSKSLGNAIGLLEKPQEMFGKLMSISDTLMWRYYDLLSLKNKVQIKALQKQDDPLNCKKELASEIVERYWGVHAANSAATAFSSRFSEKKLPENIPEIEVSLSETSQGKLPQVLRAAGLASSASQAMRLIKQGALKIDGDKCLNRDFQVELTAVDKPAPVYEVGKRRVAKIRVV